MDMNDMREPWYSISSYSAGFKVVRFAIALLILSATLGACLLASPLPILRFILGLSSASCLLFIAYNQGVISGAGAMMTHLQARARDVNNALQMMDEVIKKKNEEL